MTTPLEAYDLCSQILALLPDHTPSETNGVTYVLVRIGDQDERVAIECHLINPAIPPSGDHEAFNRLTTDQQIGVLSLKGISEAVRNAHETIKKTQHEESMLEPLRRLKALLERVKEET